MSFFRHKRDRISKHTPPKISVLIWRSVNNRHIFQRQDFSLASVMGAPDTHIFSQRAIARQSWSWWFACFGVSQLVSDFNTD